MELMCQDIEERYTLLTANKIPIPKEEVIVAFAATSSWRGLVVNTKTKHLWLVDAKNKFREVIRGNC